jgi:murein DD-endopeptidase MepM/ murein hydrolase activator NlpD
VFPVVGDYSYSNDFGDPRGQGSHQGNDIIGKTGMTLVACADGIIKRLTRSETGLGGIWIWLEDAEGNEYYYAHMHTIAPELSAGSKVTAGQVVGTMGMTGDARGTVPHLHFEIRPNGGGSINPFNELRAVDPQRK